MRRLIEISINAIPGAVSFLLGHAATVYMMICVANLGRTEMLAGLGLGNLGSNLIGYAVGIGLMSALDTFISQSAGSGDIHMSRIHLARARIVSLIIFFPCAYAMANASPVLVLLGQDPAAVAFAQRFMNWTIPGLLPYCFFLADSAYLRAYRVNKPQVTANLLSCLFQVALCNWLVNHVGWDVKGAGLAVSASHFMRWILLQLSVSNESRARDCVLFRTERRDFNWEAVKEFASFRSFVILQMYSGLTMWIEWWIYEGMTLIAGSISREVLAVHVIYVNVDTTLYKICMGFQQAASVLVGNSLGAGQLEDAKFYATWSVLMAGGLHVVLGCLLVELSDLVFRIYGSESRDLEPLFKASVFSLALFQAINAVNCVLEGVIRGLGAQKNAVVAKASTMVFVQLPLAFYFSTDYGITGIWSAASVGFALSCGVYMVIIAKTNLRDAAIQIMKKSDISLLDTSIKF